MSVVLAHPGTQHAPQLARELEREQLLGEFWTGLAFHGSGLTAKLLRSGIARGVFGGLATRVVHGISRDRIRTMPLLEVRAIRELRRGADSHLVLHRRNEAFQQRIPDSALTAHTAVIGFDTSSWLLAQRCRRLNCPFFLDRSIGHPAALETIVTSFNRRYPEWAISTGSRPAMVAEAEAVEHELASRIVVGGRFAKNTLVAAGISPERVVVNTYGVDWDAFSTAKALEGAESSNARPFRFLFVGSVTARKGIPVLLDAWRRLALRDAELWIVGSIGCHERTLLPELPGLRYFGQTPRAELPSIYAQCDVLVLPSLFEGFGLVLLEALAAGLKLITTPHTGGADILPNEQLGALVGAGNADELTGAMKTMFAQPPQRAAVIAATARIREEMSWPAYGRRWAELLRSI